MLKSRIFPVLLFAALITTANTIAQIGIAVSISANIAPPALPVYIQPACPGDGYIWTPGYWAYDDIDGYYWVPGVWVMAPEIGFLWTPCWWGYSGGVYGFHQGYWGRHMGYYGGINYGYGYSGAGYGGGKWEGNTFRYNTAVNNINRTTVHNVYAGSASGGNRGGRTSFNGPGGTSARPTQQEIAAIREQHIQPTSAQITHQQTSSRDHSQFAKFNHGKPAVAAMNNVGGQRFNTSGRAATLQSPHAQLVQQNHQPPATVRQQNQQVHQQPQAHQVPPSQVMHQQPPAHQAPPSQVMHQQPQAHLQSQPQNHQQAQPQVHQQPQAPRPQPQQFHPQPQQGRREEGGGRR